MSYSRALGLPSFTSTQAFAEAVDPYSWRFNPPGSVYAPYGWGPDFNIGMPMNYTHHIGYERTPIPGVRPGIGPMYDELTPVRRDTAYLGDFDAGTCSPYDGRWYVVSTKRGRSSCNWATRDEAAMVAERIRRGDPTDLAYVALEPEDVYVDYGYQSYYPYYGWPGYYGQGRGGRRHHGHHGHHGGHGGGHHHMHAGARMGNRGGGRMMGGGGRGGGGRGGRGMRGAGEYIADRVPMGDSGDGLGGLGGPFVVL